MKFESICLGHGKTPSVATFGASNLINIRCPLVVVVHKPTVLRVNATNLANMFWQHLGKKARPYKDPVSMRPQ